ncbi:MAG: peptidylprolyl isomerase [Sphingomonas sp.]|jgi:peptidyl-prolyl cis-trans isomerase A (cyclophilin A)|uniref:peptidylprolyl isomerase n=1 Tax=Sphingomonas sp. TaxID=28214 RepID=UPI00356A0DD3
MRVAVCSLKVGAATLLLLAALPESIAARPRPEPPLIVGIETSAGLIKAQVAYRKAPITACNFLRYVRAGAFDGGAFFRTVRSDHVVGNPVPIDVIQVRTRAGEEEDLFGPIPLERSSVTGLGHVSGALSMARWGPDTATSSFSIVVKASPEMDFGGRRNKDGQGFAVFGQVIAGAPVLRAIHYGKAQGETLVPPVTIRRIAVLGSAPAMRDVRRTCPKLG